jgi:hypothetical protein
VSSGRNLIAQGSSKAAIRVAAMTVPFVPAIGKSSAATDIAIAVIIRKIIIKRMGVNPLRSFIAPPKGIKISRSGDIPKMAPQTKVLLPAFIPRTDSPKATQYVSCEKEAVYLLSFLAISATCLP